MNGRLCLGQGGSHLLKQRDELEQSGFQRRVCERPDKSQCIHTVHASHYSWGGNEPLTLFLAATHAPINESAIRHITEAGV